MSDSVAFKRKGRGGSDVTEVSLTGADGASVTLRPKNGVIETSDETLIAALDADPSWRRATAADTASAAPSTTSGGNG